MLNVNKRRFPRVNYPCFLTIWQKNGRDTLLAHTVNIGVGGLLVYLDQPLGIGLKVDIKVNFPHVESFHCGGKILRCQQQQQQQTPGLQRIYNVAIVFEGLDEEKVSFLKKQVEKLLILENNA